MSTGHRSRAIFTKHYTRAGLSLGRSN